MAKAAGARHEVMYTKESTFGVTPKDIMFNSASVSTATADDSYNDAVADLSVFSAGDVIRVANFTEAGNNGIKHVVSATTDKMIVSENLVDEAIGDDVTIEIAYPRNVTTISTATADDSYNDAVIGGLDVFNAGDVILVSGFTTAANNGVKHVVSAVSAKLIVEENLTDEVVGDDISIEIAYPRLRNTGITVNLAKDSFTSEEIRSDRQITDLRHGNKRVEGDVSVELGAEDFDLLIEAALQGSWSIPGTGAILKAGTTQRSFTLARLFEDVGQMLVYDGVMVDSFSVSAQINAMVTSAFTVVGQTGAPPAHVMTVLPGGTIEIGDIFTLSDKDGNGLVSFTAAAGTVANVVAGLVAAWNLSTNAICVKYTAEDVATTHMTLTADTAGTWYEVIPTTSGGAATETLIVTHSPVRPASVGEGNPPFDSFTGVIKEGGGAVTNIMGVDFVVENGLDPAHVLMDAEATQFINGRSNITGTVTAYFENLTLLNKFINETGSSIEVELEDPNGNKISFLFPNVKYMSGDVPVTGEGAVVLTLPFQALYDTTEASNVKVTRTIV